MSNDGMRHTDFLRENLRAYIPLFNTTPIVWSCGRSSSFHSAQFPRFLRRANPESFPDFSFNLLQCLHQKGRQIFLKDLVNNPIGNHVLSATADV